MNPSVLITSPDDSALDGLCQALAERAGLLDDDTSWPAEQLALCGRHGVFQWFLPRQLGGQEWGEADIVRGYLRLSSACLTTTFVITQRTGACRRIAISENDQLKAQLLPDLISGRTFATVGISHLTTSRRHLARPVLRAEESQAGFVLDGFSPWVTGATQADHIVTGATLDDGRQILVAVPTSHAGVSVPAAQKLVGVSASQTGEVRFERVELGREWLLAGPINDVMQQGVGAKTGGLQTSTLAIGLAAAAVEYLQSESERRRDLCRAAERLQAELFQLQTDLLAMADGDQMCTNEELRARANSLVLRAAQAALAAAKGTGYVVGHPAGRWCREALFFLVWSCPQPVMAANLCELAGIHD